MPAEDVHHTKYHNHDARHVLHPVPPPAERHRTNCAQTFTVRDVTIVSARPRPVHTRTYRRNLGRHARRCRGRSRSREVVIGFRSGGTAGLADDVEALELVRVIGSGGGCGAELVSRTGPEFASPRHAHREHDNTAAAHYTPAYTASPSTASAASATKRPRIMTGPNFLDSKVFT